MVNSFFSFTERGDEAQIVRGELLASACDPLTRYSTLEREATNHQPYPIHPPPQSITHANPPSTLLSTYLPVLPSHHQPHCDNSASSCTPSTFITFTTDHMTTFSTQSLPALLERCVWSTSLMPNPHGDTEPHVFCSSLSQFPCKCKGAARPQPGEQRAQRLTEPAACMRQRASKPFKRVCLLAGAVICHAMRCDAHTKEISRVLSCHFRDLLEQRKREDHKKSLRSADRFLSFLLLLLYEYERREGMSVYGMRGLI